MPGVPPACYVREALPAFLAEEDPCQRLVARGAEAPHTATPAQLTAMISSRLSRCGLPEVPGGQVL
jgi:hypothetical protein